MLNIRTHHVCYILIDPTQESTGYVDLTGRFPKTSTSGNQCMLVGCHFDANSIIGVPVKNRKGAKITQAWKHLHNTCKKKELHL